MANISKIKIPGNNTEYDIVSSMTRGIYRGVTDDTSTATAFTAQIAGITSYYDGLTVLIKNTKIASASGCTLNVNGLGAKIIWTSYQNVATETGFGLNQEWLFYFDETNDRWVRYEGTYTKNTDTTDISTIRPYYTHFYTAGNGIKQYSLFARTIGGYSSISSGSGTGTSKTYDLTIPFDIRKIYLYAGSSNIAINTYLANNTATYSINRADMRYTLNCAKTLTTNMPLYLVFDKHNSEDPPGYYRLNSTIYANAASNQNCIYVLVGFAGDTYRVDLLIHNPAYTWDGTQLVPFTPNGEVDASSVNGHTIGVDVPSDAVFTDHIYTGTGNISVNASTNVISTTAEVNQNAFSNVKVGSTTIAADAKTDTLELVGSNVTLTPDATNDKVTIGITSSNVTTALGFTPYNSTNPNGYTKVESSTNGKIKINGTDTTVYTHPGSGTNPHGTTAADVGAIPTSSKGAANGVAELDANGLVPTSQLPSFVDDVLEYSSKSAFPATGETGKIYVALDTNLTYRWSGTAYVEISPSLALGETSSTAYRGDRGKIAYDHSQSTHARTDATAVSFTRNLTSGTKIGTITINGTGTDLYCQTNTDTKVTSSANHYTPATASGQDKTASASGATAAWSIDVVKGVTLNTDGKGHVTGLSVTSGKIPANPNTDTKVSQLLVSDSQNRPILMAATTNTDTTSTITDGSRRSNNVYINSGNGMLTATKFNVAQSATIEFNSTTQSLDFIFA